MNPEQIAALKLAVEPHFKAIAALTIEMAVMPAIEAAVAKSETKLDDVVAAALLPSIKTAALAAIDQIKI